METSDSAKDLMRRLICAAEIRMGQNGILDFRSHPFFTGVDWDNITQSTAPYIPEVSSPTDTSNFDVDDNDIRMSDAQPPSHNPAFSGLHLPFVGFTFSQGSNLSDLGTLTGQAERHELILSLFQLNLKEAQTIEPGTTTLTTWMDWQELPTRGG